MIRKFVNGRGLTRDLRTAVVAVIVASVVMAAPSVAASIVNADTVDHKDAVGAGASKAARAGKLVATNGQGLLPNNIIAKAPNADKVDGLDSTSFVAAKAKPGKLEVGLYGAWGGGAGGYVEDTQRFRSGLLASIPESNTTFIPVGGAFTTNCPAYGQVVPRGWLCVYEQGHGQTSGFNIYDPVAAAYGTAKIGFGIYATCDAADCWTYGSWAVRAPNAPTARPQTSRPGALVPSLR